MIWTVDDSVTTFALADGISRIYRVAAELNVVLRQTTQVSQPMESEWPRAFPGKATVVFSFDIPVTFPPCASYDEAAMQALDIPLQCPRGGVLTAQSGSLLRTYSQAWINDITVKNLGVTNQFIYHVSAINPSTTTLSPLAQMDSRYVGNLSAITGLTGGGSSKLDGLTTADVAVGFAAFITPVIGGVAQPKTMRLITDPDPGVTVTNADPSAGSLIILPPDYDAESNAKIWMEQ